MIIYKITDRIPIVMGEVKVWISPLTFAQKAALGAATVLRGGKEVTDGFKAAMLSLKYSVKEIEGVQGADGNPYELDFESDGTLTDDCANELFQLECSPLLVKACAKMSNGLSDEIEGVTIDVKGVKSVKKK
jgi:hypothetical protein